MCVNAGVHLCMCACACVRTWLAQCGKSAHMCLLVSRGGYTVHVCYVHMSVCTVCIYVCMAVV